MGNAITTKTRRIAQSFLAHSEELDETRIKVVNMRADLVEIGAVSDLASNWAFDRYSDNVREASVFFMKTGPSSGAWSIEIFTLERTVVQFGCDGGPRIVHGVSRPDATIFMLQIAKTEHPVFLDGRALRWHDMAVLAPGSHFTFASNAPAQWMAFSVANELAGDLLATLEVEKPLLLQNLVISLSPELAWGFAEMARKVVPPQLEHKARMDLRAPERKLLESLTALLSDRKTAVSEPGRQVLIAEAKIAVALEFVRSRPTENIHVNDLTEVVGVNARSLYRYFQNYLKIAPKDYLRFRQLNLVRRSLRLDERGVSEKNPVTIILSNHGVSEFGRFAIEYKRLFKETPSQTLARRLEFKSRIASSRLCIEPSP